MMKQAPDWNAVVVMVILSAIGAGLLYLALYLVNETGP